MLAVGCLLLAGVKFLEYAGNSKEIGPSKPLSIKIANFQWRPAVLLVGITALAFCLGFLYLGNKSIWWDESVSIGIARLGWPDFFHTIVHGEANMSLYYLLLHFWINLGTNELAVRSLSVLFAALSVPVVFALGSRLFNTGAGLTAALLLAVNPLFIQYAQEARSYSLVLFLASLSSLFLVEALHKRIKWLWALYILTSVLTVYAHLFGALVLASQAVSILFCVENAGH
jgi:mannosyltransferase